MEVCLQLATVTLVRITGLVMIIRDIHPPMQLLKGSRGALLSTFFVSALTFWKTCAYTIQYTELCNGSHLIAHLEWPHFVFLFLIPNGVWLVVPGLLLIVYGSKILHILGSYKDKKQ